MLNDKLFIGIITARVSASEQHKILAGIFSQAEKYNIHVAVFSNIYNFNEYHANVEVENKIYDLIESKRLDGLILTAESIINQELQMRIYNKICNRNIPVVVTGVVLNGLKCINNDVRSDFRDIAHHLIDVHGFTDIDILTGFENVETSHERAAGICDVFEEKNIPFSEKNIIFGNFWNDSGEKLAMEYISGKRKLPQAIVCANDYMAYGIIDTFFENDIIVPDDVTVISYEYVGERFYHTPILTTYRRNREAIGAKAVSILYSMITGLPEEEISLKGCMICGNTCSCKIDRDYLRTELNNMRNVQYYTNLNFCGNFEQQLTICRSINDYIRVLQDFAYLIRNIAGIYLCLYENWCSLNEKTNLNVNTNDEIMIFYRIISPEYSDSNPHFFKRHMLFPEKLYGAGNDLFIYFIPIFSAGIEIGYFIFQYTTPDTLDSIYIDWIHAAVNALNMLKVKNDINTLLTYNNLSEFHDTATGLYNRSGLFSELDNVLNNSASNNKICLVMIKTSLFFDDSRIDEKKTSVKINIEIAECLKKLTVDSGSFSAKLSDKTFVAAFIGDLSDNFSDLIADRIKILISHSPEYSKERKIDTIVSAGIVAPVENCSPKELLLSLSAEINKKSAFISEKKNITGYNKYISVRTAMYKNPEKTWNAQNVCKEFGLSSGHFRAAYKNIFEISFHKDLILAKIALAKYLLMTTSLSLYSIAVKCGYEDDKYFLRQFRQITGISPNTYRKMI